MARKEEPAAEGLPEWFGTYSDLVTLLLCFFVLLFSMATIDAQKYVQIANSLRSSFVSISGGDMLFANKGQQMVSITSQSNPSDTGELSVDSERYVQKAETMVTDAQQLQENKKIDEAANQIQGIVSDKGIADQTDIVEEKDFLLIRLDSEVFFESGKAELRPAGKEVLGSISDVINHLDNRDVLVQGHTDNVPIRTAQFASNWELSTARATNVVRYMIDNFGIDPSRLTATGNGEFRPVGDNATAEGRQRNRRIEIRIMR